MLYTLWYLVAAEIFDLANGSRCTIGALATCCRHLLSIVELHEQLWLQMAVSQRPIRFYRHVFLFGVAGNDVPDLRQIG